MSQPEPEHGTGQDDRATPEPSPTTADDETWKGKGVALRAFFYIFGTHLFAGFVWLLFYLGDHARK
ncbi:DUF6126 family protein [Streptomyces sp. NPDC032472]|uniref:DUF6126 family protein n=1 Tax=Streptomyces sp. NPDC032472 TaxID=3155018 RepID=UPI0033DEDD34